MERSGERTEDILSRITEPSEGAPEVWFGGGASPGSGDSGDWGLRANTGTEEKWSRGIRICSSWLEAVLRLQGLTLAKHLLHTSWLHIPHLVARVKRPNLVLMQRKQTCSSTASPWSHMACMFAARGPALFCHKHPSR